MRPILSRTEMRRFDERAIQSGVPGVLLMENAGRGAAEAIADFAERRELLRAPANEPYSRRLAGFRVGVVCGAGNNGGDGYVVARRLLTLGADVTVLSAVPLASLSGDAELMARALGAVGVVVSEDVSRARELLRGSALVVDALFGTGLRRPIEGRFAEVVAALNDAECPVVSLDVPSGLDAETGQALGVCVRAELTVTFGYAKRGHFSSVGHALSGELVVVDIGVPEDHAFVDDNQTAQLLEQEDVKRLLSRRSVSAHKGESGRVVVVAGSVGKVGAARLAARGALRAGAGLVTVLSEPEAARSLEQFTLEAMTEWLEESDPATSLARFERVNAFVIGPGMGRGETARRTVEAVLERPEPVVIDADALHLVRERLGTVAANGPRVLTPHPGEAAALLGIGTREVEADRFGAAARLAQASGAVVILKGSRTLIAQVGRATTVCSFGGPVLATGGTGDVLSGVLGACLVHHSAFDAAQLAVAVHALAGELCARGDGRAALDRGILASEIADAVPRVIAELLGRG